MDFALNEQQEMMQTLARDFLSDEYNDKMLKTTVEDETGNMPELWQKLAEVNLTGLAIPEEYGGVGDFLDLIVVLEEMGRACFISPYFTGVVLGASVIMEAGSEEQKQKYLLAIAEGKSIVTLALTEETGNYTPDAVSLKAELKGSNYVLNGRKLFVPDALSADYIICATRTKEGITLFIIDINIDGFSITPLKTVSGDKQCEVCLNDIEVGPDSLLGEAGTGWTYLEKVLQKANVARCAEMVGLSQQALNISLDYARERMAFGHPIGAFQSIQHRCADMLMDVDGSRFLTYQAAWRINECLSAAREAAIAKAWVSQASKRVMNSAHQIHGAIGFTQDHILQYYTKKARFNEFSFGDAAFHLEKIGTQ